ncbi:pathogen-associated molecular patterns-induced protein A70-like [Solanum stenotomum]|uniref:pathogen-associated molecular patterns-induced protein A70-like n=1 Tax=Solanum stenotomum TaxID=172797 RepID=UPI0020D070B4|nr:pathogen-associated molecular patterns-induced protein A70-like [Solanum stenotomum]
MGVMIESVLSWLTPTVLFCVLNVTIATLFITSTLRNDKKQEAGEDQLPRTPSLLQRVRSVNLSLFPDPFNYSPLTTFSQNSPSLLQRVRSINFSFSSQKPTPFPSLDEQPQDAEDSKCHVTRSKSVTCAEEGNRSRRGGGRKLFENEEEDAVDKKADDFINKFREELKMQRVHSILNNKEMFNRGVSI